MQEDRRSFHARVIGGILALLGWSGVKQDAAAKAAVVQHVYTRHKIEILVPKDFEKEMADQLSVKIREMAMAHGANIVHHAEKVFSA